MSSAGKCIGRKCVACGKVCDRAELIRILSEHKTGDLIINPSTKEFGRSFYVCKSSMCLERIKKHKKYKDKLDFSYIQTLIQNNDSRWKN